MAIAGDMLTMPDLPRIYRTMSRTPFDKLKANGDPILVGSFNAQE
jgi:hypothetical protein